MHRHLTRGESYPHIILRYMSKICCIFLYALKKKKKIVIYPLFPLFSFKEKKKKRMLIYCSGEKGDVTERQTVQRTCYGSHKLLIN